MKTREMLERSNKPDRSLSPLNKLNHLWLDQLFNRRKRLTQEWVTRQMTPGPNIAGKYFLTPR